MGCLYRRPGGLFMPVAAPTLPTGLGRRPLCCAIRLTLCGHKEPDQPRRGSRIVTRFARPGQFSEAVGWSGTMRFGVLRRLMVTAALVALLAPMLLALPVPQTARADETKP